jgi:hypothetical protein
MTVRKFSDRAADFVRGAADGVVLYQCAWKHGGYNSADYGLHITIPEFLATKAEDGYPATLAGLTEAGMKLVFTGAKFGIAYDKALVVVRKGSSRVFVFMRTRGGVGW